MPGLRALQDAMRRCVLSRDDDDSAFVAGGHPRARLAVYRNTYAAVTQRALSLNYPALRRLLGEACFDALACDYSETHPPSCAWLDAYGEALPGFVVRHASTAALPYLAQVAALEWAVCSVLHAPDAVALDPPALHALGTLAADAQATLRFRAHPAVRLVATAGPADIVWRAVLEDDDATLARVDLASGPRWLLVERNGAGVDVLAMHEVDWRLSEALFAGRPLIQALACVPEHRAGDAAAVLATHLAGGRLVACDAGPPPSSAHPEEHRS
jgi:hypothetical protein